MTRKERGAGCRLHLCGNPSLVRCAVAVVAVRTYMVVGDIGELIHRAIRVFLHAKIVQVGAFILSMKEIAKKWTMPVRDWGLAYAQFGVV